MKKWLAPVLFVLWTGCGLAFVFWGAYANDEGWYCLISREVWRGRLLYGDVRFTQMPLLPYLYGGALALLPPRIESARLLSLLFSLAGVLLLWRACHARYGRNAALGGLLVVLVHKAFLADVVSMRTQALTFALSALCFYAVANAARADRKTRQWIFIAGVAAGATLLTRLSFLPLALALPLYFAIMAPARRRVHAVVLAALGAWGFPALVAVFFVLAAGENFLFGIYGFHAQLGREENALWWLQYFLFSSWSSTGLWSTLVLVAGVVLLYLQKNSARRKYAFEWLVFAMWMAMTVIHISRHPTYATYQSPLAWGPMILTAWALGRVLVWQRFQTRMKARRRSPLLSPARLGFFAPAALTLFSIVWLTVQSGSLESEAARRPQFLAGFLQPAQPQAGEKLISFEAGLSFCVPELNPVPGYEMSEFALLPVMPEPRQEKLRGVGLTKFKRDLQTADLLVIRPRDLKRLAAGTPHKTISLQEIAPHWRRVGFVSRYGQFGENIVIWRRVKNQRATSVYNQKYELERSGN